MQLTSLGDVYLPQAFDARDLELENVVLNLEAPVTKSARPHPGTTNLRVPELFAEAALGAPPLAVRGPVFSAAQGPWNQRSLVIAYDPASGDVQPVAVRFDGKAVRRSGRRVLPTRHLIGRAYRYRFRLAFVGGKLRQTLLKAAQRPQLPRWRHVKSLLRQLTTRDFR